ncbi:hypothetical protein OG21DRAFT_1607352 [Imleria badia]|nr:hypothetical protein OG21DRAFT_1607352 [Imleria badia]
MVEECLFGPSYGQPFRHTSMITCRSALQRFHTLLIIHRVKEANNGPFSESVIYVHLLLVIFTICDVTKFRGFASANQFFQYLQSLFDYASVNKPNESSLYGVLNFILAIFCASSKVTTMRYMDLFLATFPQRDIKMSDSRCFRAPDFSLVVVQSNLGLQADGEGIGDMASLIWEVKANQVYQKFVPHFSQIAAQVKFAKEKFKQKTIYAVLSVDIWFMLFTFPGAAPSITWSKRGRLRLDHLAEFANCIAILPSPMVNEECTEFSPEFLYALDESVKNFADVAVTQHTHFNPPPGASADISKRLKGQPFHKILEKDERRAKKDDEYAEGETDHYTSAQESAYEGPDIDPGERRIQPARNAKVKRARRKLAATCHGNSSQEEK